MDDIENLLHQAQLVSVAPVLPPGTARRALRGLRRRRQFQLSGVGGLTVAVVGGGAFLAWTPHRESGSSQVGGMPAPAPTGALRSAVRTQPPASTPECAAVEANLAQVGRPAGYSMTDTIQPGQFEWERGWLRTDKAHATLEVTAFCVDAHALAPKPAGTETVATVTVKGHEASLTTDLGGAFARITWRPNASTEVSVSANGFQPNSWGRTPTAELKAARLTDAELLAFAQTVPTG